MRGYEKSYPRIFRNQFIVFPSFSQKDGVKNGTRSDFRGCCLLSGRCPLRAFESHQMVGISISLNLRNTLFPKIAVVNLLRCGAPHINYRNTQISSWVRFFVPVKMAGSAKGSLGNLGNLGIIFKLLKLTKLLNLTIKILAGTKNRTREYLENNSILL